MSREKGIFYEQEALKYLKNQGLIYLAENYKACGGEVDLIMQSLDTIVFIEVKARANTKFGFGHEFINTQKQYRLMKAAKHYLNRQRKPHLWHARFDVVSFDGDNLTWIKAAFGEEGF